MNILMEFQPGSMTLQRHYRFSLALGLIPLIASLAIVFSLPGWEYPVYYALAGVSLGLTLILYAVYEVNYSPRASTRLGGRFKRLVTAHFPACMLIIRYLMFMLCFAVVWVSFLGLGQPLFAWPSLAFYATFLLLPIRNTIGKFSLKNLPPWRQRAAEVIRYLTLIAVVMMILGLLTKGIGPIQKSIQGKLQTPELVLWTVALVIIFIRSLLFLDFMFRFDKYRE